MLLRTAEAAGRLVRGPEAALDGRAGDAAAAAVPGVLLLRRLGAEAALLPVLAAARGPVGLGLLRFGTAHRAALLHALDQVLRNRLGRGRGRHGLGFGLAVAVGARDRAGLVRRLAQGALLHRRLVRRGARRLPVSLNSSS
nr:hypothetical protein GCM10025732_21380 [Glycomyces mayteni]